MRAYLIKRLLVMVPTFFGISLIVFLVLNLAPGRPGAAKQATEIAADIRSSGTQESYRIFREQFNLDKPVLLNTLFALEREDVEGPLRVVAGRVPASDAEKIAAQQRLEDQGGYAVPHLIDVLRSTDDTRVRDVAAYFLRLAASRRLVEPFADRPDPETRRLNREIEGENAMIREMRYALDASEEAKQAVIERWLEWYEARAARWQYDAGEKLRILFLDTRFAKYWENLLQLDFGVSLVTREPVLSTLLGKLKYSITLSLGSLLLAYAISIPLGILSAVDKDSRRDRALSMALFMLYSLPSFFVASLLLLYFSSASGVPELRWFPIGGFSSPQPLSRTTLERVADIGWHLVLPIACMTYTSLAVLSRYMRAGLLDVIASDFVRTARAKGLPERTVILKHAVRNGLLPILTLLAGLLPAVLGGSVIIEYIFGIPGMGLWMIDSIYQRDYNVIMAVQLVSTLLVLFGILLTDLAYALVDPRISYE